MGKELLLEIGTEEIPARFTPGALKDLAELMTRELRAQDIPCGPMRTFGTPRRLALWVGGLGEFQNDRIGRKLGPPKQIAFDKQGHPTKAAEGFAKAQGMRLEELETVITDRGEYLCAVQRQRGIKTFDILKESLPRVILSLPFPKSMRWGGGDLRFVRPIHWVLAVFDGEVVLFQLESVRSGGVTYGHRFMSPKPFDVKTLTEYVEKLRKASVIVSPQERRKIITRDVQKAAEAVSGEILMNEELLDEVTHLVELPVVVLGNFDREFLSLPREVVVHAMEDHQRYFPVVGDEGGLLPYFVCVCNTRAKDMDIVRRGHERVLRARLSDARFFFQEDTKVPLEKKVEELKHVVFQARLGTSYEKVMRFRALACFLARRLCPQSEASVDRAAFLCKADLVTGMVGEFPTLQGIVGREYALLSGESHEVAEAIREHYLPGFAGDRLPTSPIGDFVSVADKMDTVVGCFGVGLIPTGAGDPFALRRQALGILTILLEKRYTLSLRALISEAIRLLADKLSSPSQDVADQVVGFFQQRFENFLTSQGLPHDAVEAVLATGFDDVVDCQDRSRALAEIKRRKEFAPLAVAFKRVVHISQDFPSRDVRPSVFREDAEKRLYSAFMAVRDRLDGLLGSRDYPQVLKNLAELKEPVDNFFDRVLVMDKDPEIRDNRLSLLRKITDLFSRVADFSKIVTD
jgi:glycyl-tRNA synthetase beta chain